MSGSAAPAPGGARAVRLSVSAVAHRFGARVAVRPVTFEQPGPGVVAVTGENGSGKSTLLRVLAGMLRPSEGMTRLEVEGADVPPRERRRHVGLACPDLEFYEEFTAAENLTFATEARGLPDARASVQNALSKTGLAPRGDDRVGTFSSGMKQRLRLAFAILHRPALLLLDEPGAHLDEEGRALVERLVLEHAPSGLVVLATNDPREVQLAANRIPLSGRGLDAPS